MGDENNKGTWFDDDPEWADLKRRIDGSPVPKPKKHKIIPKPSKQDNGHNQPDNTQERPKKVELSVNVTLSKPKIPKLAKLSRHQKIIGGVLVGVVVLGVVGLNTIPDRLREDRKEVAGTATEQKSKPTFDTLFPEGKDEAISEKMKFDAEKQVASFTDSISYINLTISQQPLPATFKTNTDEEVKKLAESFSAGEVIVESNPKAYLGTSVKGPQTVIFHKNGLLVFIQSTDTLDKEQWAEYITKLL